MSGLPGTVFPHTHVSRLYRYRVSEAVDDLKMAMTDYASKASWYAGSSDSGAVDAVNAARSRMYTVLPYMARAVAAVDQAKEGSAGKSQGQLLLEEFLRNREKAEIADVDVDADKETG